MFVYLQKRFSKRLPRNKEGQGGRHAFVLAKLYREGEQFALDPVKNQEYDDTWLRAYASYVMYRCAKFAGRATALIAIGLLRVIGLSDWLMLQVARRRLQGNAGDDPEADAQLWSALRQVSSERTDSTVKATSAPS